VINEPQILIGIIKIIAEEKMLHKLFLILVIFLISGILAFPGVVGFQMHRKSPVHTQNILQLNLFIILVI